MAGALKKGGMLVMELMPRETLDEIFNEKSWQLTRRGYLLKRRAWGDGGRKLGNDAIRVGKSGERETRSEIFVYSVPELAALFRRAGLRKVRAFGDYRGHAFKSGGRLVMTGVR